MNAILSLTGEFDTHLKKKRETKIREEREYHDTIRPAYYAVQRVYSF